MRQPVPFGKYLLLERISVGGMAEVFKAKAFGVEGFEKILAIKRILPSMAEDADFIQMFIDEAKIAGQLNHANIAQIFELGRVDDSHFIAMEYVWGKDLLQMQNRFRRMKQTMPFSMAAFCVAKMCEGLDYAHKKKDVTGRLLGIIHRDVSPQNVLVSYDGEIKVIDFGIAKAASRSTKTQAGVLKGKFGYMSPEQVRGLPLDRRSDIFAIATILYELLTAERLFLGESDFATLEKVRNVDVPPPSKAVPGCPPAIEKIILRGLAKDAEDRYQWAAEMQEELQVYLATLDPPYSVKQLSGWMRDQFAAEIKREKQVLEEQKKMTREMDAPSPAAVSMGARAAMRSSAQLPGPLSSHQLDVAAIDISLASEEEETKLPGEATQISTEMPPEVAQAIREHEALARPLSTESTQILGDHHVPATDIKVQSTMIFDGVPSPGNGARADPGLAPLASQSTVMLDAPVYPGPRALPQPGVAQAANNPPTSQVNRLPYAQPRRSTLLRDLAVGVLVALLVVGGVLGGRAYLLKRGAKGTLVVTISPAITAKVLVDRIERGTVAAGAALTIKDMAPGVHQVKVRAELGDFEQQVTVVADDVVVVSATLVGGGPSVATVGDKATSAPAGSGRLKLNLLTDGATVYIDGAELEEGSWKEPIPLRAGLPHEFKVVKPPLEEARFTITLKPGEDSTKEVKLGPALGHLEVKSEPSGADVNVNGKAVGQTPVKVDNLDLAKQTRVTIRKPGFASVTKYLSFDRDTHQALEVRLASASSGGSGSSTTTSTREADNGPSTAPKKEENEEFAPVKDKDPKDAKDPKGKGEKKHEEKPGKVAAGGKGEKGEEGEKNEKAEKTENGEGGPTVNPNEAGFLVANTQPWAKVLIDGKDTGKTTPIAPRSKIALKPGKHKVTFVANGKKYDFDIVIKPGEDFRLIRQLSDAPPEAGHP